jgi:hypothetical protein
MPTTTCAKTLKIATNGAIDAKTTPGFPSAMRSSGSAIKRPSTPAHAKAKDDLGRIAFTFRLGKRHQPRFSNRRYYPTLQAARDDRAALLDQYIHAAVERTARLRNERADVAQITQATSLPVDIENRENPKS